jgi:DNA repair photolyase
MPRRLSNPPNPWQTTSVDWLGEPPEVALEVYEEEAKSILSANDSPDIPFRWSVNPYRGCFHACAYCYARPTHQFLGWGAGTDFDRRIVVKTNAAEILSLELARPSWKREPVAFSGVTDCYQPIEAAYSLTRACLEVCLARRTPVVILTKGALVERDAALLAKIHEVAGVRVTISIAFADAQSARALEPNTPSPARRFQAIETLAQAGIPTGILVAPIIPGLNDTHIAELLERAAQAGATYAAMTMLRLPQEVVDVFTERLNETLPLRAAKILSAIRDVRGGKLSDARFSERMKGQGPRWKIIHDLFDLQCRRHGLDPHFAEGPPLPAQRETEEQGELFA